MMLGYGYRKDPFRPSKLLYTHSSLVTLCSSIIWGNVHYDIWCPPLGTFNYTASIYPGGLDLCSAESACYDSGTFCNSIFIYCRNLKALQIQRNEQTVASCVRDMIHALGVAAFQMVQKIVVPYR